MKRVFIILVILITAAGFTFAAGRPESQEPPWSDRSCYEQEPETVTVTGSLILEDNEIPRLSADGEEYFLMYPYNAELDFEVSTGEVITVTGFTIPCEYEEYDEYEHLMVSSATIRGKEYIFVGPNMHNYGHMQGPRYGGNYGHMQGGNWPYHGRNNGHMMGYDKANNMHGFPFGRHMR